MFVNGNLETVTDGRNTIWIKAKMDLRTAAQVSADMVKMTEGARGSTFSIIAHESCLARRNIARWAGPDFTGPDGKIIPCVPENIDRLDPNEQILADVIAKIRELNTAKEAEVTPEEAAADPTPAVTVT